MTALPEQTSTAAPRRRGDEALELASQLSDQIARERATVRALKEHVLAARAGDDGAAERLQAPRRQPPSHVPTPEPWRPLGECLHYRQAAPAPGAVLLEFSGEIDLSGALRLRQLIADVLGRDVRALSLDLAEVSFMDSNALSALLWARRQAMVEDASFCVSAVHPRLRRLLAVTKLDAILLA